MRSVSVTLTRHSDASCGTALPGEVGTLCGRSQIPEGGVCVQGSLSPQCLPAAEAGVDGCGCPTGYGWSATLAQCAATSSTSDEDLLVCTTSVDGGGGDSSSCVAEVAVINGDCPPPAVARPGTLCMPTARCPPL